PPADVERAARIAEALTFDLDDVRRRAAVRLDAAFVVTERARAELRTHRPGVRVHHPPGAVTGLPIYDAAEILKLRMEQRRVSEELVVRFAIEQLVRRREIDRRRVAAELAIQIFAR